MGYFAWSFLNSIGDIPKSVIFDKEWYTSMSIFQAFTGS